MRIEHYFDVQQHRDAVVDAICNSDAIVNLFPEGQTQVIARDNDRVSVRTHYSALGHEGDVTFHFTFLLDGDVAFEKVCDGNVWSRLDGKLSFEERGRGTRVAIELDGATKPLVPEFAIRGPMKDQLRQLTAALRRRIEGAAAPKRNLDNDDPKAP